MPTSNRDENGSRHQDELDSSSRIETWLGSLLAPFAVREVESMEYEGLLIEVDQGRVARVFASGAHHLQGGAAVTYDGGEALALPVRNPTETDEIERFIKAQREGRANTQRHGIRTACETAYQHYQAIAQATGLLAGVLADKSMVRHGDPDALLAEIKAAVNRVDDDILKEVRGELLRACDAAMELQLPVSEEAYVPPPAPSPLPPVTFADDFGAAVASAQDELLPQDEVPSELPDDEHCEMPRLMQRLR
jgi:hypothetical protein